MVGPVSTPSLRCRGNTSGLHMHDTLLSCFYWKWKVSAIYISSVYLFLSCKRLGTHDSSKGNRRKGGRTMLVTLGLHLSLVESSSVGPFATDRWRRCTYSKHDRLVRLRVTSRPESRRSLKVYCYRLSDLESRSQRNRQYSFPG